MVGGGSAGSLSARDSRSLLGGMAPRSKYGFQVMGVPPSAATQNFTKFVERTAENFVSDENASVEDVRRTLLSVRQQFDSVRHEAEQKDLRLRNLREMIIAADRMHNLKGDEGCHHEEKCKAYERQLQDTRRCIKDTQTSRKVYEHMLARIQREQAILKQKMLRMDDHLQRKKCDANRRTVDCGRSNADRVQNVRNLEVLSEDAEAERDACRRAREDMEGEIERRRELNRRKARFEGWRHEVALRSANDAFNASSGRLRRLYAIEKLSGNCLQKITFEQVERSQATEDGFQKIREVTGLTDVMDIVHKFLNRDVEHEQLKGSVKDAEVRLEALRQDFDLFKRDAEGITFSNTADSADGGIYKELERSEQTLNEVMQEHEVSRVRLQKVTLQTEHMKRWAVRVGDLLNSLDEPVRVEGPSDFPPFFRKLETVVHRFVEKVSQDITSNKINRRVLMQALDREHQQYTKTLADVDFLRASCKVPIVADAPARSQSRQGVAGDDDPGSSFAQDRERARKESEDVARVGETEKQKKGRQRLGM